MVTYFQKTKFQIVCNLLYKNICGRIFCLLGGGCQTTKLWYHRFGKIHWVKYGILDEIQTLNVFEIEFELMLVGYGT